MRRGVTGGPTHGTLTGSSALSCGVTGRLRRRPRGRTRRKPCRRCRWPRRSWLPRAVVGPVRRRSVGRRRVRRTRRRPQRRVRTPLFGSCRRMTSAPTGGDTPSRARSSLRADGSGSVTRSTRRRSVSRIVSASARNGRWSALSRMCSSALGRCSTRWRACPGSPRMMRAGCSTTVGACTRSRNGRTSTPRYTRCSSLALAGLAPSRPARSSQARRPGSSPTLGATALSMSSAPGASRQVRSPPAHPGRPGRHVFNA